MSIVARLMNLSEEEFNDEWMELYVSEIGRCEQVPVVPMGKNLYALAEGCYRALLGLK